ncbi:MULTISPECIES: hypothetical protein [Methylomonas]|uniref:Lipoprotein n=1 Tax=Methylomonas koyamae TaxID=702114 RepID=A0A177NHG4_9GAMM|nr:MULTISPECIES: hypothetical protein [Methylomonas]ANE57516.1 hypothetical protein AYM39_21570 [Methylomonas sp. DH-1]ATG92482.1 hypothetical protein MKLM6_4318 [Methylomonas koyamae]OAI16649.1 hypothetical protein A1507_11625 [Methylomonas koyamae]OAI25554.1 hypothetical protein A1356_00915 [Methylomonas koyamae]
MKNISLKRGLALALLPALLQLAACSDDKAEAPKTAAAGNLKKSVHRDDTGEASGSEKRLFEKEFSAKCVERELKNSTNKDVDEPRFKETCDCIAEHIKEDLSEIDAEKYIEDHEDTQTLSIKFDAAAYFCLQNKPQPKGPHLFGKPSTNTVN